MFILLTALCLAALMGVFCLITYRFTKEDLYKFDIITMCFMAFLSGVMAVVYNIIFSIQLSYNYKEGIGEGFTRNVFELLSKIPQVAYEEEWLSLLFWFIVTFGMALLIQVFIAKCFVQIWEESHEIAEEGEEFDIYEHYCETKMWVLAGVSIVVLALVMALFLNKESFLSHEDYSAYDMSERIEVSDDLVSAINKQCEGMNVATIIRNRIYCDDQVGNFLYSRNDSVTFNDNDRKDAMNLYEGNGINHNVKSYLEHMFVLTWDRDNTSENMLFFMVHKKIAPPTLDPSAISSWGSSYFKNLEKLIPQMTPPNTSIKSPYSDDWKELEVKLGN